MSDINIKKVAHLARLHVREEELKVIEPQLADILGFVDQLKEVKVEGVEPTSHPLALQNVFRDDVPAPSLKVEEFLKHSPKSRGRFFEVPKIIEDKS
jgi:aspartyl-tRNA(Asn)/glutamyl-tRNA(Gln) amidotransferase subunit C